MGREILYCTQCGKALTGDDFTRGRAHTFDNRQYCAKCLPKRLETPSTPRQGAKRAPSSTRIAPHVREPKKPAWPMILGVSAGLLVAVVIAAVLLQPAPAPPPLPPAPPPGKSLVDQARVFERQNPGSHDDIVRRWQEALATGGPEAKRELDRVLLARKEAEDKEIRELEEKTRERVQAEQFGAVFDVLEEARKRHASESWAKAVEAHVQNLRATTEQLYPELKAKAVAARTKGEDARVAELRAKLGLWGRKDLSEDLEKEIAKIIPREEPPAGATVLLRFPKEGNRGYNLAGALKDGALRMAPWSKESVMGGFEVIREPFTIVEKGEFWLTYMTDSEKPIILRFRVIAGDKTLPFNWNIPKPEVGRPTRVKVPMSGFQDYSHNYIKMGERVNSVYLQQDDVKANFVVFDAVIFRLP